MNMVEPLDIIVTGVIVVFLILTLLTVMMYLTGMFFSREEKKEEKTEIDEVGVNNAEKDIPGGELISSEVIATVTAALCAYLDRPVIFGVPQPLQVSQVNRTWSMAGRMEQMDGMGVN